MRRLDNNADYILTGGAGGTGNTNGGAGGAGGTSDILAGGAGGAGGARSGTGTGKKELQSIRIQFVTISDKGLSFLG
jgi:hypothetical protein